MADDPNSKEEYLYEDIVKKTKTGITFPKNLRDDLFEEDEEVFFRLVVPKEKDKIILEFLSDEQAKELTEKYKSKKISASEKPRKKVAIKSKKGVGLSPNWGEYFTYDFENQEKMKPLLESAFYKFAETPVNLEDAMGRVKYALISFLSSTKTENAKLYFSVIKFLADVIEKFNQPNLIEWMFAKIVPNIESKFLYELALLELIGISLKMKKYEKSELYIFYVLKNIDAYSKSEMYNIMNSFKQLVNKVRRVERTTKIDILLKEKLLEYGQDVEDIDYKIQIVEFLEDLNYIEMAYDLAKSIQLNLPPDSIRLEEVRKLVRRLHTAPITESKPDSSIDYYSDDNGSSD